MATKKKSVKKRCSWVPQDLPLYVKYHDEEWGRPVHDDAVHFEFLILEGAQAGLSWITILKKREGYRKAFHGFNPRKVAKMTPADAAKLKLNPEIIRNELKIKSAITNAQVFLEIQKEFGSFNTYVWRFVNGKTIKKRPKTRSDYHATSPESDALSKDLKKRGMKFVGSTVIYAHLQATGLIDEHALDCFCASKAR